MNLSRVYTNMPTFKYFQGETIWRNQTITGTPTDTTAQIVRMRVKMGAAGRISGMRIFINSNDASNHIMILRGQATGIYALAMFPALPGVGTRADQWIGRFLKKWHRVAANDVLDVLGWFPGGRVASNAGALVGADYVEGNFRVLADGTGGANNSAYSYNLTLAPTASLGGAMVGLDLWFVAD